MIESLNAVRSLGLAPVFEQLYFGREVPAGVATYMQYPQMFRDATPAQCEPLTQGGLVPIVDDGDGGRICLFDPHTGAFVVYLAYVLLEIADSGLGEEELIDVAQATGFKRTGELVALLRELESQGDAAAGQLCEHFIDECAAF